jgi:hypothetical protein
MPAVWHRHFHQAAFGRIVEGTADARHAPSCRQFVDAGARERQRTPMREAPTQAGVEQPDKPPLSAGERPPVVDDDPRHRFLPPAGSDGPLDPARRDAVGGQLPAVRDSL